MVFEKYSNRVKKDKTNLDLYLADIGMIINSTQRLQKMDKKMRQVNLSLLEVEQVFGKFVDGPRLVRLVRYDSRCPPWPVIENYFSVL